MAAAAIELRQLLIADLALVDGVVKAHHVAAALMAYWDQRDAGSVTLLAELARIVGRPEITAEQMGKAIEVYEREAPEQVTPDVLASYAGGLTKTGKADQAIPILRAAIKTAEAQNNRKLLWELLDNMAEALLATGKPAEALPLLRRSLRIVEKLPEKMTGQLLMHLAEALFATGELDEAEDFAKRAVATIGATKYGDAKQAASVLDAIQEAQDR